MSSQKMNWHPSRFIRAHRTLKSFSLRIKSEFYDQKKISFENMLTPREKEAEKSKYL